METGMKSAREDAREDRREQGRKGSARGRGGGRERIREEQTRYRKIQRGKSVSYTHLTLPTTTSV